MARLLLFVRRPYHLSEDEADRWMLEETAALGGAEGVDRILVSRLQNPALHGGNEWDWLIEMHCRDGEEASRAARDDAVRELVADLRLLGMGPRLVMADLTRPLLDG